MGKLFSGLIDMRLHPDNRKDQILAAALKVAGRPGGWGKLTRQSVAHEAQCAESLVSKYFGTMHSFRRAIMRAAIKRADLFVIAQGIASGDKCARKVDAELQARALASLVA